MRTAATTVALASLGVSVYGAWAKTRVKGTDRVEEKAT